MIPRKSEAPLLAHQETFQAWTERGSPQVEFEHPIRPEWYHPLGHFSHCRSLRLNGLFCSLSSDRCLFSSSAPLFVRFFYTNEAQAGLEPSSTGYSLPFRLTTIFRKWTRDPCQNIGIGNKLTRIRAREIIDGTGRLVQGKVAVR